ncbi:MAG: tetratricopeptide repeat protein, partial [Anaerolineae bacterium]|nr:tetratricopeptide repeat protein [Anaerolineae bacterium]
MVRKLIIAGLMVALLALYSRTLASAALHNGTGLLLCPHWQVAAGEGELPACGSGADSLPAEVWLEWTLRLNPRDGRAWLLRGRAAWLAGRCDEALRDWERALSLNPQDPAAWALYLAAGGKALHPEPAIAEGVAAYFIFLGDRSQKAEQWEDARRWYIRAFSLYPTTAGVRKLEALYLRLEQKEAAVAVWEELAVHLPASDPDHWWALGRAAELSERWEHAALFYGCLLYTSDAA